MGSGSCELKNLARIAGLEVRTNEVLAPYTTFQLGGPCPVLISCGTSAALEKAVGELVSQDVSYLLLGGGSNVLISDHGVDGVVVRYANDDAIPETTASGVTVSAAASLDGLAAYTVDAGLEGLLCCTGIPGTVGGAIVGNAGAWGEQVGDVLESVTLLSRTGQTREVRPDELDFRYRSSRLKESDDIVLQARFALRPGDPSALRTRRNEILATRAEKHPDLQSDPCIGSIFKNIEPTSSAGRRQAAGWFLERSGVKGMRVGGACIFDKHANIIVKRSGCTAQDVVELMGQMQRAVREAFDFDLEREVRLVGQFDGLPAAGVGFY